MKRGLQIQSALTLSNLYTDEIHRQHLNRNEFACNFSSKYSVEEKNEN